MQSSLFRDYPSVLRRAAIGGGVLLVLALIATRVIALVVPPPLRLEQPTDNLSTASRTITIRGTTAPGAALTINGRSFIPDARGGFTAELVLLPGTNTIELESKTRHSRTARIIRRVQVMAAEGPVAQL